MGIKIAKAIAIECVGPRCSRNGIIRSTSGIADNMRIKGMLSSVFRSFAEALLEMYPKARWPTANDLLSSRLS
jgi:hypothetical protein